ncbi:MAG: class II SORL domain-containing protein [Candidatus Korarchaeota archaeon]
MKLSYIFKTADWKTEKHVPVIEILEKAEAKKLITVRVSVGKEIPHPNTTEHHIRWIRLLFWPEDSNFPYDLGFVEFNAHGESVKGPNTSGVYTEPIAVFSFRTEKPGKLIAFSYCNIHGLWSSETELKF